MRVEQNPPPSGPEDAFAELITAADTGLASMERYSHIGTPEDVKAKIAQRSVSPIVANLRNGQEVAVGYFAPLPAQNSNEPARYFFALNNRRLAVLESKRQDEEGSDLHFGSLYFGQIEQEVASDAQADKFFGFIRTAVDGGMDIIHTDEDPEIWQTIDQMEESISERVKQGKELFREQLASANETERKSILAKKVEKCIENKQDISQVFVSGTDVGIILPLREGEDGEVNESLLYARDGSIFLLRKSEDNLPLSEAETEEREEMQTYILDGKGVLIDLGPEVSSDTRIPDESSGIRLAAELHNLQYAGIEATQVDDELLVETLLKEDALMLAVAHAEDQASLAESVVVFPIHDEPSVGEEVIESAERDPETAAFMADGQRHLRALLEEACTPAERHAIISEAIEDTIENDNQQLYGKVMIGDVVVGGLFSTTEEESQKRETLVYLLDGSRYFIRQANSTQDNITEEEQAAVVDYIDIQHPTVTLADSEAVFRLPEITGAGLYAIAKEELSGLEKVGLQVAPVDADSEERAYTILTDVLLGNEYAMIRQRIRSEQEAILVGEAEKILGGGYMNSDFASDASLEETDQVDAGEAYPGYGGPSLGGAFEVDRPLNIGLPEDPSPPTWGPKL